MKNKTLGTLWCRMHILNTYLCNNKEFQVIDALRSLGC